MRDQDKKLSQVPADFGGDRATPRLGHHPSACSESGVRRLLSVGIIIYIYFDSLECFGRTAEGLTLEQAQGFHSPKPSKNITGETVIFTSCFGITISTPRSAMDRSNPAKPPLLGST